MSPAGRVTGRVGVCEGPSGGGATYLLPGLVEANESSIPVLALNTDISVTSRNRFTLTELDQRALMKPLTKWNAVIDSPADIPRSFRQAFDEMTSGRPGAAHLALPFDVQKAPLEASEVWADPSLGSYPSRRTGPDPELVALAAKLLRHPALGLGMNRPGAELPVRRNGSEMKIVHITAGRTHSCVCREGR